MSIFFAAVEDDPLDSGGRVIEGGSCGTVKGEDGRHRKLTFLGQQAWCSKCNTAGVIVAAAGSPDKKRLYDRQRGRRQALGGDLVLCKCERHPRIIPVYGRKFKVTDDNDNAGSVPGVVTAATTSMTVYDDRFILRDTEGRSLAYTAYALRRETGTFEYGETDEKGHTHLLSSVAAEVSGFLCVRRVKTQIPILNRSG
ncbi:PAAR domain-containing protein [Trinickia violacea]|uniref:PAAR domain-containing protein n=1 Tax=Trinickia violacea TaxID=2571746 RepID=A0A4P8J060_9BURK|nr:PAAR domain-containing protein [Trinickia violacea]QCP53705.1 PAAR domain-containing protein [Trinickia violacea]